MFARKLELFGGLTQADHSLIDEVAGKSKLYAPHMDLIREGDAPAEIFLVTDGFACRYKVLPNGNRHIIGFLLPGDCCDVNDLLLNAMDHSISTLSECRVVELSRLQVQALTKHPTIARALWWSTLVDAATLREWLVNMGQRGPKQRIAHLFCEIHLRLQAVGLASSGACRLPITQKELGEAVGLTTVYVNQTLKDLKERNLSVFKGKQLAIPDIDRLRRMSGFNPNYLHFETAKRSSRR